jgi:hypothetical protein
MSTPMTPEEKEWIDKADYESLLSRWRKSSTGMPIFQGESGDYYIHVMAAAKAKIGDDEAVAISKKIGWN